MAASEAASSVEAQRAVLWQPRRRQRAGPAGTAQCNPFRRARAPPVASHAPPPPLRSSAILDGQAGGRAGVCVRCESRHECCQAVRALTRCRSRVLACVRRACMRESCGRAGGRVCLRACCSCMRVSAWCEGARWIVTSPRMVGFFSLKKEWRWRQLGQVTTTAPSVVLDALIWVVFTCWLH